ncbi:MAG TPA: RNA ligase partner protein [Candidatus Hydrothermia bacterium]|nr:RNA ligase partner protein [Candidatus Hydrothermae bacterium]MDD3648499.1 RNA ligase partner protein [Candidatus Hydrothermia bacterium]MDD5573050.1 RNA ligase partner protein [Candidatus Hydrothermia bacterium]HOK23667.1 RNA ligase partner protein [Candidatus Hydrothermia bacterium]HOL24308.1 RNA ligase partner protein [Candidatus Hydrothermia bacterium]
MERLVLDTSIFTNPDVYVIFGNNPLNAFNNFIRRAKRLKKEYEFYMPPSVFEELRLFLGENNIPDDAELVLKLKSPQRFSIEVPGFLLYELIEEVRNRINKGLRVAEEAVLVAEKQSKEKIINRLRNKYREALRSGIIDSTEDVDIILLAMELGAAIVSSDEGVRKWAEKLGVRFINPKALGKILFSNRKEVNPG